MKLNEFIPFLIKHRNIIPQSRPQYSELIKGIYASCAARLQSFSPSQVINGCIRLLDEIDELAYAISDTRDLHITFGIRYISQCKKALSAEHFEFVKSVVTISNVDTFAVYLELESQVNWRNTVKVVNLANRRFYQSSPLSKKEEVIANSALTCIVDSLARTTNLSSTLKKDFIHKQSETEIFKLIKGNSYEHCVIAC